MNTTKVRRVGNSLGATLPKPVLERLRVGEGDLLYLTETPEGFLLTPYEENFGRAMQAFEKTRKKYRNALRELAK